MPESNCSSPKASIFFLLSVFLFSADGKFLSWLSSSFTVKKKKKKISPNGKRFKGYFEDANAHISHTSVHCYYLLTNEVHT